VINWTDVAPALRTLFSKIALDATRRQELEDADLPEFQAQWGEKQREFTHPDIAKLLTLKVRSIVGTGEDERRYTAVTITPPDPDPPYVDIREDLVGIRRITLEVRVESTDHGEAEDPARWCWSMMERIRMRLYWQSSLAALLAVNIALVRIEAAQDATYSFDKRRVNACVMDVILAAGFTDEGEVIGWIERIELTSHFQDAAGDDLDEPPNATSDIIPPLP
jgi:hypothetical protein